MQGDPIGGAVNGPRHIFRSFLITPHTPRRWNLAWLVLENPCHAQFRLEIEIAPAWACCARHNENPITIVLILYNLVRSLTRLRRRLCLAPGKLYLPPPSS